MPNATGVPLEDVFSVIVAAALGVLCVLRLWQRAQNDRQRRLCVRTTLLVAPLLVLFLGLSLAALEGLTPMWVLWAGVLVWIASAGLLFGWAFPRLRELGIPDPYVSIADHVPRPVLLRDSQVL